MSKARDYYENGIEYQKLVKYIKDLDILPGYKLELMMKLLDVVCEARIDKIKEQRADYFKRLDKTENIHKEV